MCCIAKQCQLCHISGCQAPVRSPCELLPQAGVSSVFHALCGKLPQILSYKPCVLSLLSGLCRCSLHRVHLLHLRSLHSQILLQALQL